MQQFYCVNRDSPPTHSPTNPGNIYRKVFLRGLMNYFYVFKISHNKQLKIFNWKSCETRNDGMLCFECSAE